MLIFDTKKLPVKIALFACIAAALVFAWFAVRWQIGSMLGELTPPGQPNGAEIAQLAINLAPRDARPRWLAAMEMRNTFSVDSMDRSVPMFEEVVRRSPYQYRWWMELGRAYEQADNSDRAEAAFRRAVDLAPDYTLPHWQFGNFLLRQNRTDEAFAELRRATESSQAYREQVFSLAWDYFDKDPSRVEALAADTPDVRAGLAFFYAGRNSPGDSLRMWNTLPPEEKAKHPKVSNTISRVLHDKRFYREALEFSRQTGVDTDAQPETIANGGFEESLGGNEGAMFDWKVFRGDGKLDINSDSTVRHSGNRSAKFNFRGYVKPTLLNLGQLVVVEPGQNYRLTFWVRTENLRSGGMPLLHVVNANDDKVLAESPAFPTGTNDWQQFDVDFTAPENCQGIAIRTARQLCGGECPIVGIFWYDDFVIRES